MESKNQPQNVLNFCKILEGAAEPKRATSGSAGMDLCACIDNPITLNPGERVFVPCGIAISLPSSDYVALLFGRSGLGVKHGIMLSNGVGVIDSDYRGEIKASLLNIGNESYTINPGERICQLVIMRVENFPLVQVDKLDATERGLGGFGSTGK